VHSLVDKLKWFYENARCYNKIYRIMQHSPWQVAPTLYTSLLHSHHFVLIASLQVSSVMETVWPLNIMASCSVTPCSLVSHPRRAWEPQISCLASCLCSMSPLHQEETADQYIWKHRRKNSWYMSFWVLAKSHAMSVLIILLSEQTMLMDELQCHRTYCNTLCPCMPSFGKLCT